jgi:hypothetical protein
MSFIIHSELNRDTKNDEECVEKYVYANLKSLPINIARKGREDADILSMYKLFELVSKCDHRHDISKYLYKVITYNGNNPIHREQYLLFIENISEIYSLCSGISEDSNRIFSNCMNILRACILEKTKGVSDIANLSKKASEKIENRDDDECPICMVQNKNIRNTVCLKCFHSICNDCYKNLPVRKCPFCREEY